MWRWSVYALALIGRWQLAQHVSFCYIRIVKLYYNLLIKRAALNWHEASWTLPYDLFCVCMNTSSSRFGFKVSPTRTSCFSESWGESNSLSHATIKNWHVCEFMVILLKTVTVDYLSWNLFPWISSTKEPLNYTMLRWNTVKYSDNTKLMQTTGKGSLNKKEKHFITHRVRPNTSHPRAQHLVAGDQQRLSGTTHHHLWLNGGQKLNSFSSSTNWLISLRSSTLLSVSHSTAVWVVC